ncbi:MAG: hypothetical protein ACI9WU_002837, partial [Myxococcota bacterium]
TFGYTTTKQMLTALLDCAALSLILEENVPDVGFADAEAYEGFCEDGLDFAAEEVDALLKDNLGGQVLLTLNGRAFADNIANFPGGVTSLKDGIWQVQWTEGAISDDVSGSFTAKK